MSTPTPRRRSKLAGLSPIAPPPATPVEETPAPQPPAATPTPKKAAAKKATTTATTKTAKKATKDTSTAAKAPTAPSSATVETNPAPTTQKTTTKKTTATTEPVARATFTEVGLYWNHDTREQARAAYVSDLELRDNAPRSFDYWIADAATTYAAMTPQERHDRLAKVDDEDEDAKHYNRKTRLTEHDVALIDAGRGMRASRSPFIIEAVRIAIDNARTLAGGNLPPAPEGRLPIPPR